VPNVLRLKMPVKLGLKLGAVIGLHDVHAERQAANHFVNEEDGRALVARIVDPSGLESGCSRRWL
jgi:hypothetical protein